MTTADEWIRPATAAAMGQVSVRTIQRRIADGTLEAKRLGPRLVRVRRTSVENWGIPIGRDGVEDA